MSPLILCILIISLGLGTTITLASSHWLIAWVGLEINTLAIIPLIAKHHHPRAVEATTKYFIIQAAAAATLLFSCTINAWLTGQWEVTQILHPLPTTMATLALAIKLGLAPVHAWLPEVLQGVSLITGLIISTWQKLAPLALIVQISPASPELLIVLGLLSTLVGGWGGMNQTQLRKILAYSSIAHLGWIILILQFLPFLTFLTFIIYVTMTFSAFIVFIINKSTTINILTSSWSKVPALAPLVPLVLLSLAGLPPLTGFIPKWLILEELTKQGLAPIATIAALTALLSLFFYLRLCYTIALTTSPNTLTATSPWRLPPHFPFFPLALCSAFTIILLPLTPIITTLLVP